MAWKFCGAEPCQRYNVIRIKGTSIEYGKIPGKENRDKWMDKEDKKSEKLLFNWETLLMENISLLRKNGNIRPFFLTLTIYFPL